MTSPTPSEPRTGPKLYHAAAGALAPSTAWAVVIASIAVIWGTHGALRGIGLLGIVVSMIGDGLVIACLVVLARRVGHTALGLRRAPPSMLAAGVLIGVAAWYINLQLVLLINPPGSTEHLQQVVEETSLWSTVVALAVLPAITEEIVFRGVLARALAVRMPLPIAVGVSAAMFALYHTVPVQMLPTFTLGAALAFVTIRAGSALPAIVAHFLNNVSAIVIDRAEVPALDDWIAGHAALALVIAIACVGSGLGLAARGRT